MLLEVTGILCNDKNTIYEEKLKEPKHKWDIHAYSMECHTHF